MSINDDLGFYFVHLEMCVSVSCPVFSFRYLEECLGLEVRDQPLPGSNDKRAPRRWWETGETVSGVSFADRLIPVCGCAGGSRGRARVL